MKKLFSLLILTLPLSGTSQQLSQYSQWAFHQFSYNPAHAGIMSCIDIHSIYRTQWVGFDGAPNSGIATISIPVQTLRKQYLNTRHGLGARFENDRIGQFATNRMNLAYAAHFNFDRDNRLSMGIYGGIVQFSFDGNSATSVEPDPEILRQTNAVDPDFTAGFWYNSTHYYAGLVVQNVTRSRWDLPGTDSRHRYHVLMNGGYKFKLNESYSFLPHVMLRIPPRGPISFDLNLHFDYANRFGLGLGYRNGDALIAFASFKIQQQFQIIYSFDYTVSDIQSVASNTHELSLRFTTCKDRSTGSIGCPLFQ
jgi:type IX secretion system PorP/SprF family membrane protein